MIASGGTVGCGPQIVVQPRKAINAAQIVWIYQRLGSSPNSTSPFAPIFAIEATRARRAVKRNPATPYRTFTFQLTVFCGIRVSQGNSARTKKYWQFSAIFSFLGVFLFFEGSHRQRAPTPNQKYLQMLPPFDGICDWQDQVEWFDVPGRYGTMQYRSHSRASDDRQRPLALAIP